MYFVGPLSIYSYFSQVDFGQVTAGKLTVKAN